MKHCLTALLLTVIPVIAFGGETAETRVDAILKSAWAETGIQPSPICSDEQFLRRLTLDLVGRIPTTQERTEFLANSDRAALIEKLLNSPEFPIFWGELWTTQLFGYEDNNADRDTLAQWLHEQFRTNRPYDQIVEDLLTSTGESAFDGPVNFLLRYPEEPVVKVSRAFLGVRLDCARCHDHPFDRWTQTDFKRMNRFFEATERQDVSASNVRLVDIVRDESGDERPRFLTGAEPKTTRWRAEFALFLTRSRPFARNFANRMWYHFLGRGIVHPVDDVNASNPASVPALLEALADETRTQKFDMRQMIQLICNSHAYQRESSASKDDHKRQEMFAVRTIKPLTPEQWYESMCIATNQPAKLRDRYELVQAFLGDDLNADYSLTWEYRETVQGLMARLVDPVKSPARSVDELFIRFLGRVPTSEELEKCSGRSLDEVSFALLHSSEFAFNH